MDEKKRIRPQGRHKSPANKTDRGPEGKKSKKSGKSGLFRSAEPEIGPAGEPDREDPRSDLDPILTSGALEMEIPLSGESIHAFKTYAVLLKEWNEKMNLTGIIDDSGIALRHFIDSLTLIPHLKRELQRTEKESLDVIDVGTGAGFPGIPLKVVMPSLQIILLDSLTKRIKFLETVCGELKLEGIDAVHLRAEDAGRSKSHREKYDVATARAVAPLNVLCEYCLPLVRVGGIFLSMKGNIDTEAQDAEKAVITLGGTIESEFHFTLPGSDMNRTIIVIRKVRPTPAKFPRKAGKPEKEPIV